MSLHYFLDCSNGHRIPIPRPSLIETDTSQPVIPKDGRKVNVACPECGLVHAYSVAEVDGIYLVSKPDPFQACEYALAVVSTECDGRNCEALKEVHTILGIDKGT